MKPFFAWENSTIFDLNWNPVTSCSSLQIFLTTSVKLSPAICVLNEAFLPHSPSAQPVCSSRAVTTLSSRFCQSTHAGVWGGRKMGYGVALQVPLSGMNQKGGLGQKQVKRIEIEIGIEEYLARTRKLGSSCHLKDNSSLFLVLSWWMLTVRLCAREAGCHDPASFGLYDSQSYLVCIFYRKKDLQLGGSPTHELCGVL